MAKRQSNKERVQRAALEAELDAAAKSEKTTKKKVTKKKAAKKTTKKTAKKKTTRKSATSGGPQKLVWRVLDPSSKVVAAFAYPKKDEAEASAAALAERTGKEHRVRGVKVPLDEAI